MCCHFKWTWRVTAIYQRFLQLKTPHLPIPCRHGTLPLHHTAGPTLAHLRCACQLSRALWKAALCALRRWRDVRACGAAHLPPVLKGEGTSGGTMHVA